MLSLKRPYVKVHCTGYKLNHERLSSSKIKLLFSTQYVQFVVSLCLSSTIASTASDTFAFPAEMEQFDTAFPQTCTLRIFQLGNPDAILIDSAAISSDNHNITESIISSTDIFVILNICRGFIGYYVSTDKNCNNDSYDSINKDRIVRQRYDFILDRVIKIFKSSDYNQTWFKIESSSEKRWKTLFDASIFCNILINDMYPSSNVKYSKISIEDYELRQLKVCEGGFELIAVLAVSLLHSAGLKTVLTLMTISLLDGEVRIILYADLADFCHKNQKGFVQFKKERVLSQMTDWDYGESFGVGPDESWLVLATEFYCQLLKSNFSHEKETMQVLQSSAFDSSLSVPVRHVDHHVLPLHIVKGDEEDY